MAGKGFAPKDPSRLVGHGAAKARAAGMRVVESAPVEQPPLPELMPNGEPWPQQTRMWWEMWRVDPLSDEFRPTDWADLLDTAVIHGQFWSGDTKLAGELRLRVAKHGATQEDRARLRITFAAADEADDKRAARPVPSSRDRRGPLKAV
jgi:hypothetical protein